jgi:hypothetical protein
MTVSAAAAHAGPYTGNDSASSFAFAFKVFADTDIRVIQTDVETAVDTDLVLNTNYIVTRNVDQDNNPGGNVIYKVASVTTALPSGQTLTIVGDFSYAQPTDIPNGGPFFAQVIENALDRITLFVKQLKERVDASLQVTPTIDPDTYSTVLPIPEDGKFFFWQEDEDGVLRLVNSDTDNLINIEAAENRTIETFVDGVDYASGTTDTLSLANVPGAESNVSVYFDGIWQNHSTFSVSGLAVNFDDPIPTGTEEVEIAYTKTFSVNVIEAENVSYTPAGSGAVESNVRDKLRELVSVKDFGARGNATSSDTDAFATALAAYSRVFVPRGTYRIAADLAIDAVSTLVFEEGATLIPDSGDTITINGWIEAPATQIFDLSEGGAILARMPHRQLAEWWGVSTANTAAENAAAWLTFIEQIDNTSIQEIWFGLAEYEWAAPFFVPQRTRIIGMGNGFGTKIDLAGADQHAVETVFIASDGDVTRDVTMEGAVTRFAIIGINFDAADMTFTGGKRRALGYLAGAQNSEVDNTRFISPDSDTHQMFGVGFVPSRALASGSNQFPSSRCVISRSRVEDAIEAITYGRSEAVWSEGEPFSGGDGDYLGGDSFEQECCNNVGLSSATAKRYMRAGVRINYFDDTSSTLPESRPKPYAITVRDNTMIMGYSTALTGTIAINSGSPTIVTGTATVFTTELPTPSSTCEVAIRFTDATGASQVLRVASIDSNLQLTLTDAMSGATISGKTAIPHVGIGYDNQSNGECVTFENNMSDYGVFGSRISEDSFGSGSVLNRASGSPRSAVSVSATVNSGALAVFSHQTGSGVTGQTPTFLYRGTMALSASSDSTTQEVTIDAGEITITSSYVKADTEAAAASDNLDTINGGGRHVMILVLRAQTVGRTVVVRHGVGNIQCGSDRTLNTGRDKITLIYDAENGTWDMLSFADNS